MYKVRTNQTHKPFSELQQSSPTRSTSDAVQAAVFAALRNQTTQQHLTSAPMMSLGTPIPKLVPGHPLLRPTTGYNSGSHIAQQQPAGPSSFIITPTTSPDRQLLPTVVPQQWWMAAASPLRNNGVQQQQQQLTATPDRLRRGGPSDQQELTSSAVRGKVAEGLLGLRNG